MSYTIEFVPQLSEDGQWQGQMKVMLTAKQPDNIAHADHISVLAYLHRVSLVGSYWEDHMDEFIDYDFWYQNNNGLPTTKQELQ